MNPWYIITVLGAPELWAAICLFLAVFYLVARKTVWKERTAKRRKFKGILILFILSFAATFGLTYSMKAVFSIPRSCVMCPAEGCNLYCLPDSSFPSGHAATIFTFFMSLAVVNRGKRDWAALALALLVSYSRLALGVHTLIDVVAGALVGMLVVILVWKLEKHLKLGQITPKIR